MAPPTLLTPRLDDDGLMRLVQQHDDEAAFSMLYDRLSPRAFGLAQRICWTRQDAEEAVQEGFLSAWRGRAEYDPLRGPVGPWVLARVRHRAIDAFRRGRRKAGSMHGDEAVQGAAAPDDVHADAARAEEGCALRTLLGQLPPEQRRVIDLAFFREMTHTEIAETLEIPIGTVKGRIRLGLDKTRHRLAAESAPRRQTQRRPLVANAGQGPALAAYPGGP